MQADSMVAGLLSKDQQTQANNILPGQASGNPLLQADNQVSGQAAKALSLQSTGLFFSQLVKGQQIQASIITIAESKITLEIQLEPGATAAAPGPAVIKTANPGNMLISLDTKQLVLADSANPPNQTGVKTAAPALSTLTAGDQVSLQVLKTGNTPTFALTNPANTREITEQKITELLKQLLPVQASPVALVNYLRQQLPALENNPTVAETLKQMARDILAAIPLQEQLAEPAQLKQFIAQSGLFLERSLAELLSGKPDAVLQQDFKLKLLQFAETLKTAIEAETRQKLSGGNSELLKEILQKTDSVLAKLTLDQLNSLPRDETSKQGWILELPFFHQLTADSLQIEIQQDKQNDPETNRKNWAVNITITPPGLATIHCRITCYDAAVNTRFWSDAAETVDKILANLDQLKQQFELKGLKSGFMEAHQGKPAQTHSLNKPLTNLLSERV